MDPILIPILAILTGAFAIGAGTYRKMQQDKLKSGASIPPELLRQLQDLPALKRENKQLKERLENVEYIVTSIDKEILQLHAKKSSSTADELAALRKELEA